MLKTFFTREKDEWWRAEIKDERLPPIAVRGRSLQHARNKLRAKLRSTLRTRKIKLKDTTLDERVSLPQELSRKVRGYKGARERAETARLDVKMHQEHVAHALLTHKVSTRDCAEILGVSRQRAQQLLDAQRKLKEDDAASPR